MFPEPFTLSDLRRHSMSIARPRWFDRLQWWLARLILPREMRKYWPEVEAQCNREIGILDAMTLEEQADPRCIDQSRMIRIADGAGVTFDEVRNLLGLYEGMKDALRRWREQRDKPKNDEPR